MRNRRTLIIIAVLFLAIGFAAVTGTLVINGLLALGESDDFEIIFTSAKLDGQKRNDFISEDKKHIEFISNTLTNVGDETTLMYEVTNTSRNYDANVSVKCSAGENEYIMFNYTPQEMKVLAGETKTGTLTASMLKAVEEDKDVPIECELVAEATERDSLGDEYIPEDLNYLSHAYDSWKLFIEETYGSEEEYNRLYDEACADDFDSEECQIFLNDDYEKMTEYLNSHPSLWEDIDKEAVESITFVDNIEIPDNVIISWDASYKKNGSIMAYAMDEDDNEMTEIYIGQVGGVIANPHSDDLFRDFINLKSINGLNNLDTSNATTMQNMFWNCENLTALDLGNFDTSNVTDMSHMFAGCSGLATLDLSNFDTSNVSTMSLMFNNCSNLTTLDVSNFDTSNVITMESMFSGCISLTTLNVSNFDTSNVISLLRMFNSCKRLTTLDLSSFDTSNATNMQNMFWNCENLTALDLGNFDTSNVTDMSHMFAGCSGLATLDLSNFDTGKVTKMYGMFSGCSNLITLDVSNFDTSKVTDMSGMFSECSNLTNLDVSNFGTSNVTNMSSMFWECSGLTTLDISNFDTSKVTKTYGMFFHMSNNATVKVKDKSMQDLIIALSSSDRPASWTIDNVIIAG